MKLTKQQQKVHDFILSGMTNKVIAKRIGITESTVKLHVTAVLKKYGVKNRSQLIAFSKGNATVVKQEIVLEKTPIAWIHRHGDKVVGVLLCKPPKGSDWEPVYLENK